MKTTLPARLTGLLLVLGTMACEKDSAAPEAEPEFFVQAQKNAQAWTVAGSGVYERATKKFHVFGAQAQATQPEAYLRLDFNEPAPNPAVPAQAEWSVVVGGDVLTDSYSSSGVAQQPSVEITRLDTVQRILEGRFQATLRRDPHWSTRGELLQFSNGSFRVRYTLAK